MITCDLCDGCGSLPVRYIEGMRCICADQDATGDVPCYKCGGSGVIDELFVDDGRLVHPIIDSLENNDDH